MRLNDVERERKMNRKSRSENKHDKYSSADELMSLGLRLCRGKRWWTAVQSLVYFGSCRCFSWWCSCGFMIDSKNTTYTNDTEIIKSTFLRDAARIHGFFRLFRASIAYFSLISSLSFFLSSLSRFFRLILASIICFSLLSLPSLFYHLFIRSICLNRHFSLSFHLVHSPSFSLVHSSSFSLIPSHSISLISLIQPL